MTYDEFAALLLDDQARRYEFANMLTDWATGTITGGPSGNGFYPLPSGPGSTRLAPCPDRMQLARSKSIQLGAGGTPGYTGSGTAFTLTAADDGYIIKVVGNTVGANVTVRMPNNVREGFCVVIVYLGTGTCQVSAIDGATLDPNPHNHTAAFGQNAPMTVWNKTRTAGGDNHFLIWGDTKSV